eukprot:7159603-Karenia_brevis.AAC.1
MTLSAIIDERSNIVSSSPGGILDSLCDSLRPLFNGEGAHCDLELARKVLRDTISAPWDWSNLST